MVYSLIVDFLGRCVSFALWGTLSLLGDSGVCSAWGPLPSLLRKPPLLDKQKAAKILPSVFPLLHDPRMRGDALWW